MRMFVFLISFPVKLVVRSNSRLLIYVGVYIEQKANDLQISKSLPFVGFYYSYFSLLPFFSLQECKCLEIVLNILSASGVFSNASICFSLIRGSLLGIDNVYRIHEHRQSNERLRFDSHLLLHTSCVGRYWVNYLKSLPQILKIKYM